MVKKASGELQAFSQEKLRKSLERSGAETMLADEIVEHLSSQMPHHVLILHQQYSHDLSNILSSLIAS